MICKNNYYSQLRYRDDDQYNIDIGITEELIKIIIISPQEI